jgi:hypothetical protein
MQPTAVRPVVAASTGAAAVAYLALVDPVHHHGLPTLSCPFHRATGLWCPGCGLTRALHAAVTGHPLSGLHENLFWPVLVAVVGWTVLAWISPRVPAPVRVPAVVWNTLLVGVMAFGVLRNLPGFGALAP